jgi:tetratricopeptide (TPR) repeat protein
VAMKYDDFDLQIEPAGDKYRVRLLNAPTGQATSEFILPFTEIELGNFLSRIGQVRRTMRRVDAPELQAAKEFGGKLFGAIFSGEMIAQLRGSMEQASEKEHGLRIRLRLTDVPSLADLPWEFLYDANQNHFLTTSSETPVVRFLDLPQRIAPLRVALPLRVLVMIASPRNLKRLDTEGEWERLQESLGDLLRGGQIRVERLPTATLDALRLRARGAPFHVFHFIGHGGFDDIAQDGVLQFEDESGMSYPVRGEMLGMQLHDHRSLRLAVLNACEGARSSRQDPFSGVAQSLLQQRVPAVIAMQFEISDAAAKVFASEFYRAVAEGNPVDAAVCESRKALFKEEYGQEWATPVLYMRSQEGQLFELQAVAPPTAPGVDPAEREEVEAVRLAAQKADVERIVAEKAAAERAAAAEKEKQQREKTEQERAARAKADAEKAEAARVAAEKAEVARVATRKAEEERVARAERAQLEFEKAAEERLAKAKAESEKSQAMRFAAEQAEVARLAREKKERQERERAEQERVARAKAKAEAARQAEEQAETARVAAAQAEKGRIEREAAEQALAVHQKEEAGRRAKEQAAYEQLQREKEKAERVARENARKEAAYSETEKPIWERTEVRAGISIMAIVVIGIAAWLVHKHNLSVRALRNPELHYAKAEMLRSQKNIGAAIAEYREALRLNPNYSAAHASLGSVLSDSGDLENAIVEFRDVTRLNPKDSAARDALGLALYQKGYLDSAIVEYREAIRLNPQEAEAHYGLADALEKKGNHNAAVNEYREALRLQPEMATAHRVPDLSDAENGASPSSSGNAAAAPVAKKNPVEKPPVAAAPARQPLTVGGMVQAAKLLTRPAAVYPQEALKARVAGRVRVHAVIAKDGTVRQVYVVSGPPLLVKSALEVVKQSLYTPTLLDGRPVEVDTTIDMIYKLPPVAPVAPPIATGPGNSASTDNSKPAAPPAAKSPCTFGKIDYTEEGNKLTGWVPYTYQGSYPLDAVALGGVPFKKDYQKIAGLTYGQSALTTASGRVGFSIEGRPALGKKGETSDILVIAIFVKQTGMIVCSETVPYQRQW